MLRLAHAEGVVNLPSISEHLDVGKSTAHRLVTTLLAENFLQRNPAKPTDFIVGPALLEIGATALRKADIRRHARRPMERLCDQLGETVSLVILEGNSTRVVDGVESKQAIRVGLRTGVVLPANATAAGKLLLAHLPDKSLPELFPQGLPALTGATKATWPDLRQQLAQIRQDGFAYSNAESEPALNGLAVPVRDHTGEIVAAVAIAAPHFRLPLHTARVKSKFLRDTSIAITRALGGG
ncbi:IclR family transcriptional regulator [Pseudonocardia sp. RS11V-5]|uniref:IclR family transcriptional regulator n=1 Tax=Pseudonocardia terrae TaxID=2905831 RepID=UPI001E3717A6|nr:IclR family transcriptional regulator [Pseudonocardia terrae]MCE3555802.1 IclR family transcriptional regulator [Pseudonocardia terrae]